ncbi:MAG: hypothetical protein J7M34_00515 [Anaerolineae bacterium]|nr:hypothetical protein [Anaerolineae bacterium]
MAKKPLGVVMITLLLVAVMALNVAAVAPVPGTGNTDVRVMNTSSSDGAQVVAEYINQSGDVENTKTMSLNAYGSGDFMASDSGLGDGWQGSMIVSSDQEVAAVATTNYTGGSYSDQFASTAYSGFKEGCTTIYVPSLFQRLTAQYSRLTIQNTDQGTADIEIRYYDRDGNLTVPPITDSIPQGAQKTYDLSQKGVDPKVPDLGITDPPRDGWIGSAKITSTNGKKIAAVATTFWPDYTSSYESVCADATASNGSTYGLTFPVISRRGPPKFSNWVQYIGAIIQNLSETSTANVHARWTDRDGNTLYEFDDTIPPLSSHGYNTRFRANTPDPDALFAALGDDLNGSLFITSDQPIAGVLDMQWKRAGTEAANTYSGQGAGGTNAFFAQAYRILSGSTWVRYSGAVVFNLGDATANVTVEFRNPDGSVAYQFTDTIPAKSSHGYNTRFRANTPDPDALFAALGSDFRGSIHVTSDQPIMGVMQETMEPPSADVNSFNAYLK